MKSALAYILTFLLVLACRWACADNGPNVEPIREVVDLVEVNHFHDSEHGARVFAQQIFYEWVNDHYEVRAWRLIKSGDQWPQRDWERGGYRALWKDGDVWREVRAKAFRETWTQYDPELIERENLPKENRKELMQLPKQFRDKPSGAIRPPARVGAD